ncbi:MAG: glycoside hydrolase family 97 N-terminal domain-containing protein, partial [Muribaculaceae bacterium]|nr:glycoside hydrolase family 97 N-terminal domain-containing protein [Muribaculaceae bacterium]
MINLKNYIIALTAMACGTLCCAAKPIAVTSPDGSVSLEFDTKDGLPYYSVKRNGKSILNDSRLGMKLKDAPDFAEDFSVKSTERDSHSETWQPVWGEESSIDNNYNELRVSLQQKKLAPGRNLAVVFRVFNDGIGFRYEFPRQQSLQDFV